MSGASTKKGADSSAKKDGDDGFFDTIEDFVKDVGSAIGSAFKWGKPDADVQTLHVNHLSTEEANLIVDVLITNPNPVPIPLVDINYLVETDGNKLVSGLIPDAGTIHAHGSELIKIPVNINFKEVTETYEGLKPGQIVKYKLTVTLIIDVPVIGRISIPLKKDGDIPIPQKPDVDLERVQILHLDLKETKAMLHLKVQNGNPFDLGVNKLTADIKFGDVSVGRATYDEGKAVIQKGSDGAGPSGVGQMQVPITLRPKDFGSALWDIIRGKSTGYTLQGNAEVDTPFGPVVLPFLKEGGKTKFKKDGDNDDDD
ncbi:unnamed protein product [Calypogeia fissa]